MKPTLADVGSTIDTPAFLVILAMVLVAALFAWLGWEFRHAQLMRDNDQLREANAELLRAIANPEATKRRQTRNLLAALDEPYDQERDQ